MSWRQGQSYAQDLRERVLAAVDGGMPVYQVAPVFRVSVSYIYKALARRRRTGETSARRQRSHTPPKLLPYYGVIEQRVAEQNDATLAELQAWLHEHHDVTVSQATLWTTLRRLGLTLKKSRGTPPSRTVPMSPKPAPPGAGRRSS